MILFALALASLSELACAKVHGFEKAYKLWQEFGEKPHKWIEDINPDASGYAIVGTDGKVVPHLKKNYKEFKDTLGNVSSFVSRFSTLAESGKTATFFAWNYLAMPDGCQYLVRAYDSLTFDGEGEIRYEWQHSDGMRRYGNCSSQQDSLPYPAVVEPAVVASDVKGYKEFLEANERFPTEGGLKLALSRLASGAKVHSTMGKKVVKTDLAHFFETFAGVVGKLKSWVIHWDPLMVTGQHVTFGMGHFGVFNDGCEWGFTGFASVSFDDEGKVTYMWQHLPDLDAFFACMRKQEDKDAAAMLLAFTEPGDGQGVAAQGVFVGFAAAAGTAAIIAGIALLVRGHLSDLKEHRLGRAPLLA